MADKTVKKVTGNRTLTKADIAAAVHREIGLSKTESAVLVTDCLDHISSALGKGENVKLTNFGTFKLMHKKARYGRNPRTGETALVTERKVVTFKASPHLTSRLNIPAKSKS